MEEIVDFVGVFSGISESQTAYGEAVSCYRFDGFIANEEDALVRSLEIPLSSGKSYDEGKQYGFRLAIEGREYSPKEPSYQPILFSLYESFWDYFFIVKVLTEHAASSVQSRTYTTKKLLLISKIKREITTSSKRLSYSKLKSVFSKVNSDLNIVALPVAQADSVVAKSNSNLFFDIGLSSPYNKSAVDSGVTTPQQMEFCDCNYQPVCGFFCFCCNESFERENFTFITHFDTDHYSYLHGKGRTDILDFERKLYSSRQNKFNRLNCFERMNVLSNYYVKSKILSGYFVFPLNIEAFENKCIKTISDKYLAVANLQFILEIMVSCEGFYIISHSKSKSSSIKLKFNNGGRLLGNANWIDNDANNSGVSYSLNLPRRSYLFTGDKGFHHLPNFQMKTHYDALMACHHGAEVESEFIPRAASPNAIACFSFGFNDWYKHPKPSAIQQASEYKVIGTCEHLDWHRKNIKPANVEEYQNISIRVKLS
jgi:hypothetical protein